MSETTDQSGISKTLRSLNELSGTVPVPGYIQGHRCTVTFPQFELGEPVFDPSLVKIQPTLLRKVGRSIRQMARTLSPYEEDPANFMPASLTLIGRRPGLGSLEARPADFFVATQRPEDALVVVHADLSRADLAGIALLTAMPEYYPTKHVPSDLENMARLTIKKEVGRVLGTPAVHSSRGDRLIEGNRLAK